MNIIIINFIFASKYISRYPSYFKYKRVCAQRKNSYIFPEGTVMSALNNGKMLSTELIQDLKRKHNSLGSRDFI